MRLVRSGEEPSEGAVVELPRLFALAKRWYGDRLDPDWRPRTRAQSQQILTDIGLTGGFWQLV